MEVFDERTGDELIPSAQKKDREPDRILAVMPQVQELIPGSGIWEPIDPTGKVFLNPIFLVDPKFTEDLKEKEKMLFEDNDYGGY